MRRREFIALVASAAALPLASRAQQPTMPVIGFLSSRSTADSAHLVAAFREGLGSVGYIDRQNVEIELRWADGQYDRLPSMAADLVSRRIAVLVTVGGEPSVRAARAATSTIPIVFAVGGDPVELGLVASFNRPGGNITGVSLVTTAVDAKRLGVLHELVPTDGAIGALLNPNSEQAAALVRELQEAARAIRRRIHILNANDEAELESAFVRLVEQRVEAMFIGGSPFFDTRRDRLIALAAQHRVPAIHVFREHAAAGGLISYGPSITDGYHQVGVYAGRILKGAKPAELPVVQSAKFELVINLKTAKALGLTVPASLLARADEVIE